MAGRKKIVSDERIAECEAIRKTFVPKEPEWTPTENGVKGDFGDYVGWASTVQIYAHSPEYYVCWMVGRKIVNELFGRGRLHVAYGFDGLTIENAKQRIVETVLRDREKRNARDSDG